MLRTVKVTLEDYNERSINEGLKALGFKGGVDELTDEQLSVMLSYALGYVNYQKPSQLKAMLDEAGVEY